MRLVDSAIRAASAIIELYKTKPAETNDVDPETQTIALAIASALT